MHLIDLMKETFTSFQLISFLQPNVAKLPLLLNKERN